MGRVSNGSAFFVSFDNLQPLCIVQAQYCRQEVTHIDIISSHYILLVSFTEHNLYNIKAFIIKDLSKERGIFVHLKAVTILSNIKFSKTAQT